MIGAVLWFGAAVAVAAPARGFEGERAVEARDAGEVVVVEPAPTPTTTTPATTTTTTPTTTTPTTATTNTNKGKGKGTRPKYRPPRLVIGGGPVIGPHSFGNEECRDEERRCETKGTFFGVGGQVELRAQIWKPLFVHGRVLAVGNATPLGRDPVHRGLWGLGFGIGAYAKRAFVRGEYVFVDTFGEDRFARPFATEMVARDRWGHHAGLFSVGLRQPFKQRYGIELWGGLMVGPGSRREIPNEPVDERVLLTFLLGVNITYDLVPARAQAK